MATVNIAVLLTRAIGGFVTAAVRRVAGFLTHADDGLVRGEFAKTSRSFFRILFWFAKIMDESDPRKVIPLHAIGRAPRGDGRPRTVKKRPRKNRSQGAYEVELRSARDRYVEADPVLHASQGGESIALIEEVRLQTAKEAAALKWNLKHMKPGSRDWERCISRRIRALVEISRLTADLERADPARPTDTAIRKVLRLLRTEIEGAAREVLPADVADALRMKLGERWPVFCDELPKL